MHSTLLYVRSQPLREGDVYRVVVYPATSPYLATLTVTAREPITIAAGTYHAIKLDLQLNKIGKKRELGPHKKFRRASIWVSDDSDRLLAANRGEHLCRQSFRRAAIGSLSRRRGAIPERAGAAIA